MPWHLKAMKDVVSCDKLRGVAHTLWSGDFRMGKPTLTGILHLINKCKKQTTGSETSQYRQEYKSNEISLVVASEREEGQT